ncbi:uncharacterized protein LOC119670399 [Teleopsis dalmanni]|uniref:uncharacterized protein LOC119670399 n=1 Tax=Teleopsis dalmanni TaxID=139649 RepID=UPI0018CF5B07|nr:uncharacterized protein LOC119670399 [Teleopsis dalmanni]
MSSRVPPPPCPAPLTTQLIEDLQRLSEDQESADIVFICGREEERIYAHRILLMTRCKSFKSGKRGEISMPGCTVSPAPAPGAPIPVRLPSHVNPEVFRQFILYIYTAKILLQDSRVFEMMTLAQDMGVEELRAACEDHVISTLSVDNACTFLTAVMEIHDKAGAKCAASFMERCIIYIGENANECVKTNAFLNLTKDALIKLISSDYFCLEEEDVWRCVLAWAKNQAGVTQPTPHWTEEERVRVCNYLSGVMSHVRLLLIDSKVFAEEVEPTGAVPMELSLERYRYAALHANQMVSSSTASSSGVHILSPGLSEDDKRLQPRLTVNMFPGSQILRNDKMHLQGVLNGWYGSPKQTWRLVYRASTHGFSSSAFHHFCDGVAPCFVIGIGSRGEISGGFTDVAWAKTNRKGGYIHSERAFLFALNPSGDDTPIKFEIIKKPYAICYHPDCGPIFGAGADLLIANNCNSNLDSYSNLPHSYDGHNASYMTLYGDYNFMLADYEVYTLASSSNSSSSQTNIHGTTGNGCLSNTATNSAISGFGNGGGATMGINKAKYERY